MIRFLLYILFFIPLPSLQSDIHLLNKTLSQKEQFDSQKDHIIDSLRQTGNVDKLARAYKSYCYDSALVYARQALIQAQEEDDATHLMDMQFQLASIYMAGGRFKECRLLFDSISLEGVDTKHQSVYYSQQAHLLYDIANMYSTPYPIEMRRDYEQALDLVRPGDSLGIWNLKAQLAMFDHLPDSAIYFFRRALDASKGYTHSEAIFSGSLAQAYLEKGDSAQALHYWIQAAVRDMQTSTKEVSAMQQVAYLLSILNYDELAYQCICSALKDAWHYNSRHRQIEVEHIVPIIDEYHITQLRERNTRERTLYICIVVLLFVFASTLVVMLYRLRESNRIQQTYLASMLATEADNTEQFDRYQKHVMRCVRENKMKELLKTPSYMGRIGQRTNFYKRFDTMFLHLYPHFVEQVNRFLNTPMNAEPTTLPSELRVFALMRLGITDNEQMTRILSYSLSTIHTYKAHVYSNLKCSKEYFINHIINKKNLIV